MVGSRAEKHHSSRVGKNWVMMGFCSRAQGGVRQGSLGDPGGFAYMSPPQLGPGPHNSQGSHVGSPEHLEVWGEGGGQGHMYNPRVNNTESQHLLNTYYVLSTVDVLSMFSSSQ